MRALLTHIKFDLSHLFTLNHSSVPAPFIPLVPSFSHCPSPPSFPSSSPSRSLSVFIYLAHTRALRSHLQTLIHSFLWDVWCPFRFYLRKHFIVVIVRHRNTVWYCMKLCTSRYRASIHFVHSFIHIRFENASIGNGSIRLTSTLCS